MLKEDVGSNLLEGFKVLAINGSDVEDDGSDVWEKLQSVAQHATGVSIVKICIFSATTVKCTSK